MIDIVKVAVLLVVYLFVAYWATRLLIVPFALMLARIKEAIRNISHQRD